MECFGFVRRPKKSDLAHCDICTELRVRRNTLLHSKTDVSDLATRMKQHAAEHRKERRAMMGRILHAELNPEEIAMLTLDYTSAMEFPVLHPTPKVLVSPSFSSVSFRSPRACEQLFV
jgi:hypothetical protein